MSKKIYALSNNLLNAKKFIRDHEELQGMAIPISKLDDIIGVEEGNFVYLIHGHNWNKDFFKIFEYCRSHNIQTYRID